jgi:phospholipid/cholesterol/gamma-HCH transport system substrate-binding protein
LNDTKVLEVKVGITILVGVTMLVLGIVWLKGITFKPNTFQVSVVFNNTSGLQVGDAVTVSGMRVGKVSDIVLEGDSVIVIVSLSNSVNLKSDASAVISSVDFFGGKRIELTSGKSDQTFDKQNKLHGTREPDLTELTSQFRDIAVNVKGTLEKVDSVLIGVNGFIGDKSVMASLKKAIYNLDSTTARVKLIVDNSDNKIDSVLTRLSASTKNFKSLLEKTDGRMDTSFGNIAAVTRTVVHITASLDSVSGKIQRGEGTLGRMIYDDSIYRKLDNATAQIDSLLSSVRQKGMKINVKLFGN